MQQEELLSRKQAAQALGITPTTVTKWLQDGYLKGRKVGPYRTKRWRIPRGEVDRLLREDQR